MRLNHFLSFGDQPYFNQDVSHGTRTLNLDSREHLIIPNVVRTVTWSTAITQYFRPCHEEGFEPLGRSTLFQILKVREASKRKSLQGLDNIAARRPDGFDALTKTVDDLEPSGSRPEWCEATRKELKEGNCYLKKEYRAHCGENESPFPNHCTRYALSDPQSTHFQDFLRPRTLCKMSPMWNSEERNDVHIVRYCVTRNQLVWKWTKKKTCCTMPNRHRISCFNGSRMFFGQRIKTKLNKCPQVPAKWLQTRDNGLGDEIQPDEVPRETSWMVRKTRN